MNSRARFMGSAIKSGAAAWQLFWPEGQKKLSADFHQYTVPFGLGYSL